MIECAECGASQYEGALFCSECGQSLLEAFSQPTNVLPFAKSGRRTAPPPLENYELMSAPEPLPVTFVIPGQRQRLTAQLVDRVFIGRADIGADAQPEFDLTDYEGMDKGVSRLHASLQMTDQGIVLSDLDSTNGTQLNNVPLSPGQLFLLQSGDEICFGDLLVHVFFEL